MPAQKLIELRPGHPSTIAAASEPRTPDTVHLVKKGRQGTRVAGDAVVRVVSLDLPTEIHVLVVNGSVKITAHPGTEGLECPG